MCDATAESIELSDYGLGALDFGGELRHDHVVSADGFEVFPDANNRPTCVLQRRGFAAVFVVSLCCLVIPVAVELDDEIPCGRDHVAVERPAFLRMDDRVFELDRYTGRYEFVA
ncbi:hypothetical protein ASG82_12285 [Mycobacterium sp. Soil538]|nr:hypothetical protein ASG82_12285 [Mycobacterium sp. Soil538]